MEWHEELDFEENPFDPNNFDYEFELIGRDKEAEDILYMIASGNMVVLEGKVGTGKTALLKYAVGNFRGKGKVIYVDGNKVSKRLNITKLLKKRRKGMILLMDNVQFLSKANNQRIKYYYDEDYIKSVVFTTTDYDMVSFTAAIRDRIGDNIIKLKNPTQDDALETAKKRLDNKSDMLPDDVLKQLYKQSKNIKEFIVGCNRLCSYLVETEKKVAEKDDIENISLSIEEEETKADLCPECREKLVKVGESWRCENCDQYCKKCGAIIEDEDEVCPECSAGVGEDIQ